MARSDEELIKVYSQRYRDYGIMYRVVIVDMENKEILKEIRSLLLSTNKLEIEYDSYNTQNINGIISVKEKL